MMMIMRITVKKKLFTGLVIFIIILLSLYHFCDTNPDRCMYDGSNTRHVAVKVTYLQSNRSQVLSGHAKWIPTERMTTATIDTLKALLKKDNRSDGKVVAEAEGKQVYRFERVDLDEVREEEKEREESQKSNEPLNEEGIAYSLAELDKRMSNTTSQQGFARSKRRYSPHEVDASGQNADLGRFERIDTTILDPGSLTPKELDELYNKPINGSSNFMYSLLDSNAPVKNSTITSLLSHHGMINLKVNSKADVPEYNAKVPKSDPQMDEIFVQKEEILKSSGDESIGHRYKNINKNGKMENNTSLNLTTSKLSNNDNIDSRINKSDHSIDASGQENQLITDSTETMHAEDLSSPSEETMDALTTESQQLTDANESGDGSSNEREMTERRRTSQDGVNVDIGSGSGINDSSDLVIGSSGEEIQPKSNVTGSVDDVRFQNEEVERNEDSSVTRDDEEVSGEEYSVDEGNVSEKTNAGKRSEETSVETTQNDGEDEEHRNYQFEAGNDKLRTIENNLKVDVSQKHNEDELATKNNKEKERAMGYKVSAGNNSDNIYIKKKRINEHRANASSSMSTEYHQKVLGNNERLLKRNTENMAMNHEEGNTSKVGVNGSISSQYDHIDNGKFTSSGLQNQNVEEVDSQGRRQNSNDHSTRNHSIGYNTREENLNRTASLYSHIGNNGEAPREEEGRFYDGESNPGVNVASVTKRAQNDDNAMGGRTATNYTNDDYYNKYNSKVNTKHTLESYNRTDQQLLGENSKKKQSRSTTPQLKFRKKTKKRRGIMFFKDTSCRPLHPNILLFNRIFKTGSTSLNTYMTETGKNNNFKVKLASTEDWYKRGNSSYPRKIEKFAKEHSKRFFSGHFFFRKDLRIRKSFTYINQLRDPVDRIISHYHYMRTSDKRPKERILEMRKNGQMNETLNECFLKQHRGCENNVMTRFFCGNASYCKTGSADAIKTAKYNMKHFYAAIGILDRMDDYLLILKKRLPRFFSSAVEALGREKASQDSNYSSRVSQEMRDKLRIANSADYDIYSYAKSLFSKQLEACKVKKLSPTPQAVSQEKHVSPTWEEETKGTDRIQPINGNQVDPWKIP